MSAPVLEQYRGPIDLPAAEQNAGVNFLAIVRRRWPWVLVGLFIGIVGGLLAYTARPAIYQSNAQLLVVKKRETLGSLTDGRAAMMEDYMSTQATILKSEKVLTTAAKNIPDDLRSPYPPEIEERVKLMNLLFTVAREKDPNNPVALSNVLNISMKGSNPEDCKRLLEVIIRAYTDELRGVYDEATNERMQLLNNAITQNIKTRDANIQQKNELQSKMSQITKESAEVLQARFSKGNELIRVLKNEIVEISNYLDVIRTAPPDKKERALLLSRLGSYSKNQLIGNAVGRVDQSDPNYQKQELQAQLVELNERLGKDHELIKRVKARIEFFKTLNEQLNPGDPEGKLDGLTQLEQFLKGRAEILDKQLRQMQSDNESDVKYLSLVVPIRLQVDSLDKYIEERQKKIDAYEQDLRQTELTRASGGYQVNPLNQPSRDMSPVAPKLSQSLLLGIAAGLLFGIGLAALAELSDKGFRSPADIRARLGLPVIGHIPPIRTNMPLEESLDLEPTLVSAVRPKSVEAEAYRGVRTALYFNAAGATHQMIQVTSPNQGDGKSTLAANLAISIAQSGKRTLLVDCDMRRPRVHRVFHIADSGPGLAAVIGGNVPLSSAIKRTAVENLSLLPCGKKPANPAELLTSPNFQDLIDRLKADYDYVILDTPPVLAVSDPSAVAPRADGVILVFRMTSKVRPLAERATEQLTQIGANIIGVVVNGSGGNSGGYGYGGEYTSYTAAGQYMDNYADEGEDESDEPPKKG